MLQTFYDSNGRRIDNNQLLLHRISQENHLDHIFVKNIPIGEKTPNSRLNFLDDNAIKETLDRLVHHRNETKEKIIINKKLRKLKAKSSIISKDLIVEFKETNENDQITNIVTEKTVETKPNNKMQKKLSFAIKSSVAELMETANEINEVIIQDETDKVENQRNDSSTNNEYVQKYAFKVLTPVNKFIRAIKTINLLLKATTTNVEQSKKHEKKYLTFTDIQNEIESNYKKSINPDLAFDLSDFKAKKEKTLGWEAINILKKHKSLRTQPQVHLVVLALTEVVEAFSEFPIAMQEALVIHGWYEKYNPKQVIIRQGHAAQNFYFIISGTTTVTIARKNDASGESYGETVAFLKKGNSFGELALMYGGKRNASVICLNNVELLSVTREDFIDIFMNLTTDTEPEHIKFLRNISILEGWPINLIPYDDPGICLFTYFRRGTVLCRDSNKSDWVYIICSGSCKVIKGLKESIGKHYQLRYNPQKIEGLTSILRSKQNTSKMVYIQLNVLRAKEVFGLESVAFELIGGTSSVTLVSEGAECVAISKSFFCQNMPESYLRKLRYEIQPFPEEENLVEKLQNYADWSSFQKEYTNNFLKERK